MGWAGGSELMGEIIDALKRTPVKIRKSLYRKLIPVFEGFDCDTLYECCDDKTFDAVYRELRPEHYEDEDEGEEHENDRYDEDESENELNE